MKKLLASLILLIMVINLLPAASSMSDGVSVEYIPPAYNLGIGYISPSSKLHVNGTTATKGFTLNGNTFSIAGSASQGSILFAKQTGVFALLDNGASSSAKVLTVNGNTLSWKAVSGSGATNIDGLSDAKANATDIFVGNGSGAAWTTAATYNAAFGVKALKANTTSGLYNTAMGYMAGNGNTTGDDNVAIGHKALHSSVASQNVAIGSQASYSASATGVVAIGYQALYSNTTGGNLAIGHAALRNNTSGDSNIAIGSTALYTNVSGVDNTGVGSSSLYSNTASGNTGMGAATLQANTSGAENTTIGAASLFNNSTGSYNTSSGYRSLFSNTTGGNNVTSGHKSLYTNKTGANNIAIGYQSLYTSNGDYNTALGSNSLYHPAQGYRNTAVGYKAGEGTGSNSFSNGTFLGYQTGLDLTTGGSNTLIGFNSGNGITTGSKNITLGYLAGDNITTGSSNIVIGDSVDAPSATASNQLNIGNTIYANGMTATTKKIGIAKANPANTLHVNGQIMMANGTTACSAAIEGSQRYNSTGKRMEFCDGIAWRDFSSTGKPSFFYVHRNSSDQTSIAANTDTTVNWTTEAYDYNSEFNTTTDRFTPTRAGQYMITFKARLLSISDAKFGICRLLKNTSNYAYNVESVGAAVAANCIVSTVVYLNGTSDYVEAVVRHNDTASTKSLDGQMNGSYMTGFRISD